ncbi:hypothetical protein ANACOL_01085 [Anaerotruncus colihominis DSM 17241]|uniref:Uncharacterized protein n=1 Tax=Anaerotruncus colihominis DSM 17241 TaxID=445972 RepID=B0P8J7_9FIRM|nr:hypothetical protein ANACOL_01085 [Anaerotruncus colihominis DSM 17241]
MILHAVTLLCLARPCALQASASFISGYFSTKSNNLSHLQCHYITRKTLCATVSRLSNL